MDYSDIVAFHGHECPGLTIGYRMACTAMRVLNSVASAFPVACCGVSERMPNDSTLRIEDSPQLAAESFNADRSSDEELVAIVENNACGVDALQCVSGCTFGKGNLIFRDYGKQAYTLYSRRSKMAVRVVFHGKGIPEHLREDRAARARYILEAPEECILSWSEAVIDEPEAARISKSIACVICGEYVMESRLRKVNGNLICIPCAEKRNER